MEKERKIWSRMSMEEREHDIFHHTLLGDHKSTKDNPRVFHCPRCGEGLHRLDGREFLVCCCGHEVHSSLYDKLPGRFYKL